MMMYPGASCQGKQSLNDKYKSQNCRAFYREKFCFYGKRCHFRHEYRSFQKIHRHYYMAHLCAFSHSHSELLEASRDLPDGTKRLDKGESISSAEKWGINSDLSTDSASEEDQSEEDSDCQQSTGRRLAIFQTITSSEGGKEYNSDISSASSTPQKR